MTRDPEKWAKSMSNTVLRFVKELSEPSLSVKYPTVQKFNTWVEPYMMKKYHRDRLLINPQQELLDHCERVKQLIPAEKLLIYEVGEEWERLVKFLEVEKPTIPFPHANDAEEFKKKVDAVFKKLDSELPPPVNNDV
ncbi:hypothetical protein K439DRAFT_1620650 [Ramaria rubella]|nr:hypothetical protein K439DRAFT_1620650 [Ramaria rubella]